MSEVTLDNTLRGFLAGPVAINLTSDDAALLPSVARGYGCRVSADGRRITVFLSARSATAVLRDLRAGAAIAVVLSRPQTHATLQFKGTGAAILKKLLKCLGVIACPITIALAELGCGQAAYF